jgi:hypothetical protein
MMSEEFDPTKPYKGIVSAASVQVVRKKIDEGEFKKRLLPTFSNFAYETAVTDKQEKEIFVELDEILDEARKEFEQLIFGTWSVDEEGFHENAYAEDSWLTPSEAIKWFRKWFGGKK